MSENNLLDNYEAQINKLEHIVNALESGELSLDDALKQYEQGIQLVRHCQKALDAAEQKVQQLSINLDGEESLIPFDTETDDNDNNIPF